MSLVRWFGTERSLLPCLPPSLTQAKFPQPHMVGGENQPTSYPQTPISIQWHTNKHTHTSAHMPKQNHSTLIQMFKSHNSSKKHRIIKIRCKIFLLVCCCCYCCCFGIWSCMWVCAHMFMQVHMCSGWGDREVHGHNQLRCQGSKLRSSSFHGNYLYPLSHFQSPKSKFKSFSGKFALESSSTIPEEAHSTPWCLP